MDRVSVFVDAGYLLAEGGALLAGSAVKRAELELDILGLATTLREFAETAAELPLLRIYWYDGAESGPTAQHTALAFHDRFKVRLGRINKFGQQKGVDSLIVRDLINLARTGAMATAVLLTGDEDVRVGVQQVQDHGVVVHLVGIAPAHQNQSDLLLQEADITHVWDQQTIARFLTRKATSGPPLSAASATPTDDRAIAAAQAVIATLEASERSQLRALFDGGEWRVPPEYDRLLMQALNEHISPVGEPEKRDGREAFKESV